MATEAVASGRASKKVSWRNWRDLSGLLELQQQLPHEQPGARMAVPNGALGGPVRLLVAAISFSVDAIPFSALYKRAMAPLGHP